MKRWYMVELHTLTGWRPGETPDVLERVQASSPDAAIAAVMRLHGLSYVAEAWAWIDGTKRYRFTLRSPVSLTEQTDENRGK